MKKTLKKFASSKIMFTFAPVNYESILEMRTLVIIS